MKFQVEKSVGEREGYASKADVDNGIHSQNQ